MNADSHQPTIVIENHLRRSLATRARMPLFIMLAMAVLIVGGCQTARPYAASPPTDPEGIERNHGYALLYATIEDETRVDQVLMIKNPRSEVRNLLREITTFARDAKERLDDFAKADDSLGFNEHGLPHAEARTRDLITQTTTRAVMLSGGRAFEMTILATQHDALNYIRHLAVALKEMDEDADRLTFLKQLADDAETLHDRVIELLHANPDNKDGED